MKRVLSFWTDYCSPSSTCCRRACSGCTPPCSAGSARTSWGWGLCLVLGFYQMGVLPNFFWPGILTRYIWFWDLNQMEDWPSYSTAWWLSEDGGESWGISSPFIEFHRRRTREVTLRAWLHVQCPCSWYTCWWWWWPRWGGAGFAKAIVVWMIWRAKKNNDWYIHFLWLYMSISRIVVI